MPKNKGACDPAVKRLCKNHSRCSKGRHLPQKYSGEKLLQYASSTLGTTKSEGIIGSETYQVCHNMARTLGNFFSSTEQTDSPVSKKNSSTSSTGKKIIFSPVAKINTPKRKTGPHTPKNKQIEASDAGNASVQKSSEKN